MSYPKDISNIIIIRNPVVIPRIPKYEFSLSFASGIKSYATTNIIAPAAKDNKYGNSFLMKLDKTKVIIELIGSTIPDRVP